MIAAMMPEDRFSGIALAEFGAFAVHGPDLALGKSTDLAITEIPRGSPPRVWRRLIRCGL
jgi:hypothetical protein